MATTKNDFLIMADIAKRSEDMEIGFGDRISRMMDLEVAYKQFPDMRLSEFLVSDPLDFVHDFCGIQGHIDRRNVKWVDDLFMPRFA